MTSGSCPHYCLSWSGLFLAFIFLSRISFLHYSVDLPPFSLYTRLFHAAQQPLIASPRFLLNYSFPIPYFLHEAYYSLQFLPSTLPISILFSRKNIPLPIKYANFCQSCLAHVHTHSRPLTKSQVHSIYFNTFRYIPSKY